jgi:hypothetical protein
VRYPPGDWLVVLDTTQTHLLSDDPPATLPANSVLMLRAKPDPNRGTP